MLENSDRGHERRLPMAQHQSRNSSVRRISDEHAAESRSPEGTADDHRDLSREKLKIIVTVSPQAYCLLHRLLHYGIYGLTIEDVIERIVDEKLREFVKHPLLTQDVLSV
jgi:hypothetical protein